jgi:branched-chain amino acid transport system permease protein
MARLAADLYLAAAAVAVGLAVGLAGMPTLGQGAFMAVGAFCAALLAARAGAPTAVAVAAGALAATLGGGAVGVATAHLRPALVAVMTWLLAWLVALGLLAFPALSGGAQGIVVPEAEVAGARLTSEGHYAVALALVVLAVAVFATLARRPGGLALAAARQHLPAALTLGVPVARRRAGVFTATAGFGGLAGALAVQLEGVADASAYGPLLSFTVFVAVVLGGAVSPIGGIVGVAFLALVARVTEGGSLESLQASRVQTFIAAVVVLAAVGFTDRGLVPSLTAWRRRGRAPLSDARVMAPATPISPVHPASFSARGLTKRYGTFTALGGLDLELTGGTIHALVGPNGSGKTTALRLLAGALAPDAGTVRLDGRDITADRLGVRVERGIVRTLQATAVFPELTALENAIVGATLRATEGGAVRAVLGTPKARASERSVRETAHGALAAVGLSEAAEVPAGELPGAVQRRLMIAAALATQPQVLLLDEPAAGAGRAELDYLAELLDGLRACGLAILLVEHNLRLVRAVADRATALEAGRPLASGAMREVLASEPVRRAYLGRRGS